MVEKRGCRLELLFFIPKCYDVDSSASMFCSYIKKGEYL